MANNVQVDRKVDKDKGAFGKQGNYDQSYYSYDLKLIVSYKYYVGTLFVCALNGNPDKIK